MRSVWVRTEGSGRMGMKGQIRTARGGEWKRRLPGYVATGMCIVVTCLWTMWGVAEMFHEGWYRPFEWLFFLLPAGLCLAVTMVALAWPHLGGWLLIACGGGFYAWYIGRAAAVYRPTLGMVLSWFPVSGVLVLIGALFLVQARRGSLSAAPSDHHWWRHNLRYLLAVGFPVLLGLVLSIEPIIRMSGRVDDGYRGERLIEGNGVVLSWAPAGPGWVVDASSLTWNQLALYGLPPVGFAGKAHGRGGRCTRDEQAGCATEAGMQDYSVCRYLSDDGGQLLDEPADHWRMPTVDELVRSLVRHGENAGCRWDWPSERAQCTIKPDKETPLWDPTAPVIYYWSADASDAAHAYKVAYNGGVQALLKFTGLGSCGYRCVRDTQAAPCPSLAMDGP